MRVANLFTAVRPFFNDNLEAIAFCASLAAAVPGALALLLVWVRWTWLRKYYREFLAKCAVAFFRAVAAMSAIAAKSATPKTGRPLLEQPWTSTVLIAIAGYLCWEVAGAIGDHKSKIAKEKSSEDHQREIDQLNTKHEEALEVANQDREDAELQALRLNWLLTHLRQSISEKRQRIRRVAQATAGSRPSIQQVREALAPEDQVHILLEYLASLFRYEAIHHDRNRYNQNFRVGLFVERDGRLEPLGAFDLATRNHEPFSSYAQHAERYRLDNVANPSQAVRCVREGQTLIVPNCREEPGFEFFNERQRSYLRSMVAHPLTGFCPDGVTSVRAVLLVDTDVAGFFSKDDREMLELRLGEFAARIGLEYAISGLAGTLVAQRRGSDDRNHAEAE